MSEESSPRSPLLRIGALWKSNGKAFATGVLGGGNDVSIVILENDRKEKASQPDFAVFLAKRERRTDTEAPTPNTSDDEDLPF